MQLKLEVGKKYLTRDGRVFRVCVIDDDPKFPVGAKEDSDLSNWWYTPSGLLGRRNYSKPDDLDLISEYIAPNEETKA